MWNYDPYTRRLAGLTAGKDELFLNLAYTYDNVGNVKSLANNVPVPPASQMGGPTLQSFVYDDLYRYVRVRWGGGVSPPLRDDPT